MNLTFLGIILMGVVAFIISVVATSLSLVRDGGSNYSLPTMVSAGFILISGFVILVGIFLGALELLGVGLI